MPKKGKRTRTPKKRSRSGSSVGRNYYFDDGDADRAVLFIETFCRHWQGPLAGEPLILQPWQREIVREIFGWKRPDGTRRYRLVYIEVPKKNGKTILLAAIGLYLLGGDGEEGAEIIGLASSRGQARLVFRNAKRMVEQSPALRRRFRVFRNSITHPRTSSVYEVMSSEAPTKHGPNASAVLFDELHAQRSRELWDTLAGAGAARAQPLTIAITTAGYDETSICGEMHDHALKVRDGVIEDPSFLPVVYAADPADDWTDPETWARANPNLGVSVSVDFLEDECRRAQASPAKQNAFRQLHLDQWTEQAERWIDLAVWSELDGEVELEALEGRECFAGLDLSSEQDLSALVLLFPPDLEAGEVLYRAASYFWMPEANVRDRVERFRLPYDVWVRDGWIETTDGETIDQRVIRDRINELGQRFSIQEIAYDRWGAQKIRTELEDDGFTVVQFSQAFISMNPACRAFEHLLSRRWLAHGDNPVLRWMAGNVAVKRNPDDLIRPDKKASAGKARKKIDGIVALLMATGRAMTYTAGSVYDHRGIRRIGR